MGTEVALVLSVFMITTSYLNMTEILTTAMTSTVDHENNSHGVSSVVNAADTDAD